MWCFQYSDLFFHCLDIHNFSLPPKLFGETGLDQQIQTKTRTAPCCWADGMASIKSSG